MFSTNNHDYLLQRAGLIQKGDLNTGLHNTILSTAALMYSRKRYQPIRPSWKRNNPLSWISQLIQWLFSREHQPARKQIREKYHPSALLPGN